LPKIGAGEDRPYTDQDFTNHLDVSHASLETSGKILSEVEVMSDDMACCVVVPIVLLCGEHTDASKPWTQERHVRTAYKVLGLLKTLSGDSSLTTHLLRDDCKLLKRCLEELHPKLDEFRDYPGAQASFFWLMHHVQFPHLSAHIHEFLPFALRFLDDWEGKNKLIGVQCLRHLIENVNPTELSWYGRTDLIVEALNRNLVAHCTTAEDLDLMSHVCLCWFALLKKTEHAANNTGKPNGWDRLAKVFIYKMEMATENPVKVYYAKHLVGLIDGLGHRSISRWTKSLFGVIGHHLEQTLDVELRSLLLTSLEQLLQNHVSANHSPVVFEILIRLLYGLSKGEQHQEDCLEACARCLSQAVKKFPTQFLELCHDMDSLTVNVPFDETIRMAFEQAKASTLTC